VELIRGIADVEAIERVPLEKRLTAGSTYELFRQTAAAQGDRLALRYLPTGALDDTPIDVTHRELFARITRTANLFHSLKIAPGKAVAYLLPNLLETHDVLWGGEAAGIVTGINYFLEAEHIAGILNASGAEVLVAYSGDDFPIWPKVPAIRAQVPRLKTILHVGPPRSEIAALDFAVERDRQPGDHLLSGRRFDPQDVAAYFHTGGTTGVPKITPLTHFNETVCALTHTLMFGFTPQDSSFCGMPLFHGGGVKMGGLVPLSAGGTVHILGPAGYRNPAVMKQFWKLIEKYRCTYFPGPPTVFQALTQVPIDADISSLKFVQVSAAPTPVELFRAFKAHTGHDMHEAYGVTESTLVTCGNPRGMARVKHGSAGIRMPYTEQKIVALDAAGKVARDCETDEIGSIVVKAPTNFPGYLQPEANKGLWAGDGFLNTGDLGRQDGDGYFWITGRQKEIIIRGGHNIDPALIEEPLYRHPAVALAAAVGKPDVTAGELPIAFVVLKPGAVVESATLLAYARDHIAERAAVPKEISILSAMPLTGVGKINKLALRYESARMTFEEALAPLRTRGIDLAVSAGPHPTHGTMATVRILNAAVKNRDAISDEVRRTLSGYAIRHEIRWLEDPI
jgi:fatty-acyl-CoA synthase